MEIKMKWRIKDLVEKAHEISYASVGGISGVVQTIVSDEDVQVSKGQTVLVKIKPVIIPKNHISFLCAYARHPLGNIISLVSDAPKKIEELRSVEFAAFQAWEGGVIERGDVIGAVDCVQVEIKRAA